MTAAAVIVALFAGIATGWLAGVAFGGSPRPVEPPLDYATWKYSKRGAPGNDHHHDAPAGRARRHRLEQHAVVTGERYGLREAWLNFRMYMAEGEWTLYAHAGMRAPEGYGYGVVPRWCRWWYVLVSRPASALYQAGGAWICLNGGPIWIADLLARFCEWTDDVCSKHATWYRWNAPDEPERGEIGFHSLSDGTRERSPMRIYVNPEPITGSPASVTVVQEFWSHP